MAATLYSWEEVAAHSSRADIWIVVENSVYNITKFLDEHPGGEEVLIEQAGQDATEAFEEIGHSDDARKMLKNYKVGDVKDPDQKPVKKKISPSKFSTTTTVKSDSGSVLRLLIPVLIIVAFFVAKYYSQPEESKEA
ncbi:cytochrome b5 [Gonapodya prolifera JEL478]|uniref:Cytochrome b5 n=1 Tax=Gonapodya prolifera (strain JEL478) TaxID=1344416 RepID=A0A139AXB8_GONPJ|nr:cytochrome b5 [Gonapodya prolifera JEL478]|eukprot:KXS21349.1 cytochrome b5 [Gonapodya prolifera JEL478]